MRLPYLMRLKRLPHLMGLPAFLFVVSLFHIALTTCGKDSPTRPNSPNPAPPTPVVSVATRIELKPPSATLDSVGDTIKITARVLDQHNAPIPSAVVTWSSSDASVVTVNASGLVTATGNGTATVTARSGTATSIVPVTVMQVAVSIVIEPSAVTLMSLGSTIQLTATVVDRNGQPITDIVITWQSSNTTVATVSASGLVTAFGIGTATITALSGSIARTVSVVVTDTARDRDALVALYHSTNGPEWTHSTNWLSESPLNTWYGVNTDDTGQVTSLELAGNHLSGPIPVELGNLKNLSYIRLHANGLSGPIPPALGQLRYLTVLGLGSNELTDPIPPELSELQNLEQLYLYNNRFKDPIPVELGQLKNLRELRLDGNKLPGPIPAELGQLKNLEILALGSNQFSGTIPVELGQLQSLESLYLGSNLLSGSIPSELGQLLNLRELGLGGNQLSGSIPGELGKLQSLTSLSLSNNNLSGSIPSKLGNLQKLTYLGAFFNQLTGSIPPDLGQLQNLESLQLYFNHLSGSIPNELGQLQNLRRLGLSHNSGLEGPLPETFIMLSKLVDLDLSNTQICVPATDQFQTWVEGVAFDVGSPPLCSGFQRDALITLYENTNGTEWTKSNNWNTFKPLSEWYGITTNEIGQVTGIDLVNNNLSGTLPGRLSDLDHLTTLNLSFNTELSGSIPLSYTSLGLESLLLEGTSICAPRTSAIQEWLSGLQQRSVSECAQTQQGYYALETLYHNANGPSWKDNTNWLSDEPINNWYGVRANALGEVYELRLQNNNLRGTIPAELGQLRSLKELSLDSNELSGSIPAELGQLQNLISLSLNDNELSGSIPIELGQLQSLTILSLDNGNLSGSIPPELSQLQNLESLSLRSNLLAGPIPPELGQLQNLTTLSLIDNSLFGSIPAELGRLQNLEDLLLTGNILSGTIPAELGQLQSLENLWLYSNRLSGAIPAELGNLQSIVWLLLDENELSGSIPAELGRLQSLTNLSLGSNKLSGTIPAELGRLQGLFSLSLYDNDLSGPIPAELGQSRNLDNLLLSGNRLSGKIPPELGHLQNLRTLWLHNNELTGNIPIAFGDLSNLRHLSLSGNTSMSGSIPTTLTRLTLDELLLGGTQLCAPSDARFQEWLGMIGETFVAPCIIDTRKPWVYLTQATQSLEYPVPLVAGEDAFLRVFVSTETYAAATVPAVRAIFYKEGSEAHRVEIPGSGNPIPSEIDEGDLHASANARIPGSIVTPGLEMVLEIDPENELNPSLEIPGRVPSEGRMVVDVAVMPLLDLTVVPFLWDKAPNDLTILDQVEGLTEESDLFRYTRDILPVGDFSVRIRESVWTSTNPVFSEPLHRFAGAILEETAAIRAMDGASGHYMGVLSRGGGIALTGNRVFASALRDETIAHELGHNMNLDHAPCGNPGGIDPGFPYEDGTIGAWGYDLHNDILVSPHNTHDIMSYCRPEWISDYNFSKALKYRLSEEQAPVMAAAFASVSGGLLVWGGVNETAEIALHPSFAVDAPPLLPNRDGPYRLTGEDRNGAILFQLAFAMPEVADAEGKSFAFILPMRGDWPERLYLINLSGPEGLATLGGEAGRNTNAAALLFDPTGRVRGILRDWAEPGTSVLSARRVLPETGLEVIISNGVPEATDWRW